MFVTLGLLYGMTPVAVNSVSESPSVEHNLAKVGYHSVHKPSGDQPGASGTLHVAPVFSSAGNYSGSQTWHKVTIPSNNSTSYRTDSSVSNDVSLYAPTIVFNAVQLINGLNGTFSLFGKAVKVISNSDGFIVKVEGYNGKIIERNKNGRIHLSFHHPGSKDVYSLNGWNGFYNEVTTNSSDIRSPILVGPSNLSNSIDVLVQFDDTYELIKNLNYNNSGFSSDIITCGSDCGIASDQWINTSDLLVTDRSGVQVTQDFITVTINYDSKGIISGGITLESNYDVSYESPFFSCKATIKDSLGFSWSPSMGSSGSAFGATSYTHQDTEITFEITLTFGPVYQTCFGGFTCAVYTEFNCGTHQYVPQLTG